VILGLTGSPGSGKSTVARMISALSGAPVIDADEIAHQVQRRGGPAFAGIVAEFGDEILGPDGEIDRHRLAQIVFGDPTRLARLNAIVHPKVRAEELRLIDENRNRPLVIFMVPLLFENGLEKLTDRVAVVVTQDALRRERLKRRSGWSDSEISARLAAQLPDAEKIKRADFVIDNSGSLEETERQVRELLSSLGCRL
jgi:dephospho-CoA kinase